MAWILYQEDHGIRFYKNTESFPYFYDGKEHHYFPDFKLEDGTYIEIKGRKSKDHCDKKTQFKISTFKDVIVLYADDMKPILSYVRRKHGNDFISLYEGNPYTQKLNKCEHCGKPAIRRFCSRRCNGKKPLFKQESVDVIL